MIKPKFYKKTLSNRMKIIFEERKNSGVVSLAFGVKYGGIHENAEEKGISHFIEHMLFKGTKTRTAKQISTEIEKNGGVLNGYTEEEIVFYFCKLPSSKIKIGLNVLSDMVKNPLFFEKELNKEKQVIFEEMKIYRDNPRMWVQENLSSCLFEGSCGMPIIGNEQTLEKIDRKKMQEKFQEIYKPENMFLCVVGEANFKDLCGFVEKTFRSDNNKKKKEIKQPDVKNITKERIEKRKGIDQANLVFAFHVPSSGNLKEKSKNYAAKVLICLMAGGMSSRLWQEIREKRNLAYSVNGGCSSGKNFGYIQVSVGCLPENVGKVRKIILEEFGKVKNLDEKELNQVKEQLIGNSKISKEDSEGQMLDLIMNEIWTKAEDSYKYESEIAKVKLGDVKKLAQVKNYSFLVLVPEEK